MVLLVAACQGSYPVTDRFQCIINQNQSINSHTNATLQDHVLHTIGAPKLSEKVGEPY